VQVVDNVEIEVPFAIPKYDEDEIQEVADVIQSGWLTTGSRCEQIENPEGSRRHS